MIDPNPCHGCTERYTACHDRCERREKWLTQYHAQQKHLQDCKNRWSIPMTESRQKAYYKYYQSKKSGYRKGGSDEQ